MIYVIEPHADDAFLSLGGHIEKWVKENHLVAIVTVFSGTRKRARDAKAYADAVGAQWIGLGLVEGGCLVSLLTKSAREFSSVRDYGREYMLPVGILHPDHKAVRDAFERELPRVQGVLGYYLDQPYASKTKNAQEITDALRKLGPVQSYLKPHARKYRHIPLFKDQAKFFHFNPAEVLKHNPEMIFEAL